jgi:hypothetical protein
VGGWKNDEGRKWIISQVEKTRVNEWRNNFYFFFKKKEKEKRKRERERERENKSHFSDIFGHYSYHGNWYLIFLFFYFLFLKKNLL